MNRRRFGSILGSGFASCVVGAFGACTLRSETFQASDARLTSRPNRKATTTAEGTRALGLERGRDAILQMPAKPPERVPLLVLLHGASGSGQGVLRRVASVVDETGVAVLAPDSRDGTWDAIREGFGRDVAFLDRALARVFDTVAVDAERIAVGGFSDGASYALSLGLINGDLFRKVVAFSPGFVVDGEPHGKPQFYISHGTNDPILPIDQCSRLIVPRLQRRGYQVTFREFAGRHEVPPEIASDAMNWLR